MKKLPNKVFFDFSLYFRKEIKFEEYFYSKNLVSSVIKNTNHLNEEMKNQLNNNPAIYRINGRKIIENLSFEDNHIENGNIISVSKSQNRRKLPPIINYNKNGAASNDIFLFNRNTELFKINENKKEDKEKNSKKNKKENLLNESKFSLRVIIISLVFIIISILAMIYVYYYIFKEIKKEKEKEIENNIYYDEKLISKLQYKLYQIYNLLDINKITYIYQPKNNSEISEKNKNFNLTEYIHYTFGIEKEDYETDNKTNIKKKIYNGFLAINNITIENETDIITNLYLNELNQNKNTRFLKDLEKKRNLNEKQILLNINDKENFTQPIISFEFYKNGIIKQVCIPNNLSNDLIDYLYNALNKFLPKLNESLFCKNITEELNKNNMKKFDELYEILDVFRQERNDTDKKNDTNLTLEENNQDLNNRRLYEFNMNNYYTKYKIIITENNNKRNLESNINNENNAFLEEIEYIDKYNKENELNFMEYFNYTSNNNNISNNYTSINQYKEGLAGEDGIKLDNSTRIVLTNIEINDDLGIIKSINCNTSIILNNNLNTNRYDENKQINKINNNEINENDFDWGNNDDNLPESPINSIIHYSNNSLINKDNDIIINKTLILKLRQIFNKYTYKLQNETIYGNKTLRILKSMSQFDFRIGNLPKKIIVENISISDYENEQKQRKLNIINNNYKNTYYGLKDINILKNIYNRNILGFQFKGEVEHLIIQSNGKTLSNTNIYFGNYKLSFNIGYIQTNIHIITKNLNEMTKSFVEILKNIEKDLILRNQNYSQIIINIEKNISEIIDKNNLYDFSNEFKNPINKLNNEIKNFSSNLFDNLLILIDNAHSNYSLILDDIKLDKLEHFKMIREITKLEYINFINSVIDSLDYFSNNVLNYIDNLEILIQNITNIKLDLLYDIIDNIEESKKIFKNIISLLFNSVIKGIKNFRFNLDSHIEEIFDELLYIIEFISSGLKNNEILKSQLDEETKNITIYKLKDFKNILLKINNILTDQIINDYDKELINADSQNIRFIAEKKKSDLKEKIEYNSNILIKNIKNKINLLEKYELYSSNIDKLNEINDEVENAFAENIFNIIINNFSSIKPDILDESSELIKKKKSLFRISKTIKNEINKEINEVNKYVENYANKYKEQNIYNLNLNIFYISKSFTDESMNNLIQNYLYLIRDTIDINLRNIIDYNYDLAKAYFNEVIDEVKSARKIADFFIFERITITQGVLKKIEKFMSNNININSLIIGEDLREIIIKNFYSVKEDILNFINNKLLSIKQYYLNEGEYSYYFNFISRGINEIMNIIDIINNYFNEEYFEINIEAYYLKKISDLLNYESNLENSLSNIVKDVQNVASSISENELSDDICLQLFLIIFVDIFCEDVEHNDNINKIIDNLKSTKEYTSNYKKKIVNNFISEFSIYFDNFVEISQKLYNNLYNYTEKKINDNGNINIILNEYNKIIYDFIDNNYIFRFYNNESKSINLNIEMSLEKVNKELEKINNDFYDLYYLNNKTDYLQFPYEIIIKCKQIINELEHTSNLTKLIINYIYKRKIKNQMEESYNFINDINNNNFKYIILHSNFPNIFKNYSLNKESYLNNFFIEHENNLHDLIYEVNNNFESYINILNYQNYESKFKNIIRNFEIFINEFNQTIYNNFTKLICENKTNSLNPNLLNKNCSLIFFETELNYSKYNFQISKIRNSIMYIKNIYENNIYINELSNDENIINRIINRSYVQKKDEIINYKYIWSIFNDSLNSLNNLNNETKIILKDYYDILSEDFLKSDYSINNDNNKKLFSESIQILNRTLNNNYEPFNNKIKYDIDKMNSLIDNQLNDYKISLINLFNEINEYYFYSVNISNINITIKSYIKSIDSILVNYKKQINTDYLIHNSYLNSMEKLYRLQIEKYKEDIGEFSNNFNFELLNMTLDLDLYISEILNKDYEDLEFPFIFENVKIFEENKEVYMEKINNIFINLKNKILNIFQDNYNTFLFNLTSQNNYVSNNFIIKLKENYTYCYNYSKYSLKEIILEDELNWERYENYTEKINNCSNEKNINSSFCQNIEEINYINETKFWLNCNNNNFFNFSNIIIEDLDDLCKNKINYIINNISNILNEFLFDGIYLENFFFDEFSLNVTEINNISSINLNDFFYDFENFQDISEYLSYHINNEYINDLKESFIQNFNDSYFDFIKDYLINEINISLYSEIIDKINMNIIYISKKIIEENKYYIYLLSNTKELGSTTKESLLNLYPYLFNKVNDTVSMLLEIILDENLFYFYKENKNIFSDFYINYLIDSKNNEDSHLMEIFKFNQYLNDLIDDREFNKSLQNISERLLKEEIMIKLKEEVIKIIYQNVNNFSDLLFSLSIGMNETLDQIITLNYDDELLPIVTENKNFIKIVNNQNNRFNFEVSDSPFITFDNFTSLYLIPPLNKIKEQYNQIEDELLKKAINIIDNFDNKYEFIKSKLDKENKIKNIEEYFNETNNLLDNNLNILFKNISAIKDELFEYTYKNGLNGTGQMKRNLNIKYKKRIKSNDNTHIINNNRFKNKSHDKIYMDHRNKNKERILYSNSESGSYNLYHIQKEFKNISKTINSFNKDILSSDFKKINNNLNIFVLKVQNYLIQLERTIDLSALKISGILTKESITKFKEKLYYQYNLINSFVFDYIEDITYNIINYINLLNFKTNITFISQKLNETIFYIYDELSFSINNKFEVLNYGKLKRRRLDWLWENEDLGEEIIDKFNKLNFPISFSINLFDYLKHCGINISEHIYSIPIDEKGFKLNFKFEFSLIIGFEFGFDYFISNNDFHIYIDLFIEVGTSISAEFGYFKEFSLERSRYSIKQLNKLINITDDDWNLCRELNSSNNSISNKITNSSDSDNNSTKLEKIEFLSLSFAAGVSINIASVRIGLKYEYSTKNKSNQIVFYINIKVCCIKFYIYLEFKFLDLFSVKLEFGFELLCLYEKDANKTIFKNIPNLNAQ